MILSSLFVKREVGRRWSGFWKFTSGFAKSGQTPMVGIYTGHREESQQTKRLEDQRLAYTNDSGRTWTQYSGNPVIDIGSPESPSLAGQANGNREAPPPWMERSVRRPA